MLLDEFSHSRYRRPDVYPHLSFFSREIFMDTPKRYVSSARVYVREDDRYQGRRLYEVIFNVAREMKLAGATIIRGVEGFGLSGTVHSSSVLRPTEDLPIIIEIIDSPQHLDPFIVRLKGLLDEAGVEGLITVEDVRVVRSRVASRLDARAG